MSVRDLINETQKATKATTTVSSGVSSNGGSVRSLIEQKKKEPRVVPKTEVALPVESGQVFNIGANNAQREAEKMALEVKKNEPTRLDAFKAWSAGKSKMVVDSLFDKEGALNKVWQSSKSGAQVAVDPTIPTKEKVKAVGSGGVKAFLGLGNAVKDFGTITLPKSSVLAVKMIADLVDTGGEVSTTDLRTERTRKFVDKGAQYVSKWAGEVANEFDSMQKESLAKQGIDGEDAINDPAKFGYGIGSGVSSIATYLGLTALTKNPALGSAVLGWTEGSDTYSKSLVQLQVDNPTMSKNEAERKASKLALTESAGIAILEKVGMDALFRSYAGGKLRNAAIGSLTETAQETTQTVWSNLVEKYGYNDAKGIFDDVFETIFITAPVGFFGGGLFHNTDPMQNTMEGIGAKEKDPEKAQEKQQLAEELVPVLQEEARKMKEVVDNPQDLTAGEDAFKADIRQQVEEKGIDKVVKDLADPKETAFPIDDEAEARKIIGEAMKESFTVDTNILDDMKIAEARVKGRVAPETAPQATETTNTVEDILDKVQNSDEARSDWEENFGAKFDTLTESVNSMTEELKNATDETQRQELATDIAQKRQEMNTLERSFVSKYKDKAEEGVKARVKKAVEDVATSVKQELPVPDYFTPEYNDGESNLIVEEGDYIVNRNGELLQVTSGNREYLGTATEDNDIGAFRAKSAFGENRNDYLEFANQSRMATAEELKNAGLDETKAKKEERYTKGAIDKTEDKENNKNNDKATRNRNTRGDISEGGDTSRSENGDSRSGERGSADTGNSESVARGGRDERSSESRKRSTARIKESKDSTITELEAQMRAVFDGAGDSEVPGFTKADEVLSEILVSFELAEAGTRLFIDGEVRGVSSSFPSWIPESSRTRDDLDYMIEAFEDVRALRYPTNPRATKKREFADALFDEMDMKLGVDTRDIRNNILTKYESETIEGESAQSDAGIEGEQAERSESVGYTREEIEKVVQDATFIGKNGDVLLTDNKLPTEAILKIVNAYVPAGGRASEGAEGRGLLDEYYTPPEVIDMVMSMLHKEGVFEKQITVLEPSAGTGNFLNAIPQGNTVFAREINDTTARIAKLNHPDVSVNTKPLEDIFMTERGVRKAFAPMYDLVVGNPPYGQHRGTYKGLGEESKISRYETYFIKRSLDLTKEGGYVAMVVPSSFLRSGNKEPGKALIAEKGRLVSAIRLPNGTFDTTGIGTDILVFERVNQTGGIVMQERVRDMSNDAYFKNETQNVLGTTAMVKGRYGEEEGVKGTIDEAVEAFKKTQFFEETVPDVVSEEVMEPVKETLDEVQSIPGETLTMMEPTEAVQKEVERRTVRAGKTDTDAQKLQLQNAGLTLGDRVKQFVPTTTGGEFITGTVVKDEGSSVIRVKVDKKHTENANLANTEWNENWMEEKTDTDVTESGDILDLKTFTSAEDFENGLWKYTTPTGELVGDFDKSKAYYSDGKWYNEFNYLQGNIYTKLDQLETDKAKIGEEAYTKQKEKLTSVLPPRMPVERMKVAPNARFTENVMIGSKTLQRAFLEWIKKLPYNAFGESNLWNVQKYTESIPVRGGDKLQNEKDRRTRRIEGDKLFSRFLVDELNADQKKAVEDAFNRSFNGYYRPDYSEVPLTVKVAGTYKGSKFNLREVQKQGIGFVLNHGSGLIAHDVGIGKTIQGIIANFEMLARGNAKRPLIVVPNTNVYKQWVKDIRALKPDVKINELSNLGGDFKGDLSTLVIPDGSISILTEEGFKKLGFTDETYNDLTRDFMDVIENPNDSVSARQQEKNKQKAKEDIAKGIKGTSAERSFEDLGFDALTIDEIHNANHIISKAKMGDKNQVSEFRGFSQMPSEYGLKSWLASQYIQKKTGGRNVIGLSATPFTNHPLEYYSILSLFARKQLVDMGIINVNDFMTMFMDVTTTLEFKADGSYTDKSEVRGMKNYQQWQQLLTRFVDFRGAEGEPDIKRPNRNTREYIVGENSLSAEYKEKAQDLFKLTDAAGMLQGIGELRRIAFSPYASRYHAGAVSAKTFVEDSPKLKLMAELIKQSLRDVPDGGQLIYSPVGVEYFPLIKQYLVSSIGLKDDQVEIISGQTPKNKRSDIQERFNAGKVKVVIGSDAIQEGVNLQEQTTDLYLLAQPWNFTAVRQVIGRAWRQGNKWRNVRINQIFTENSIDIFMSQKLQNKEKRYEESLKHKADTLDVGDIDYEEMKHALLTDPVARVVFDFDIKKKELEMAVSRQESEFAYNNRKNDAFIKAHSQLQKSKDYLIMSPNAEWVKDNIKREQAIFDQRMKEMEERGVDVSNIKTALAENERKIAELKAELLALPQQKAEAMAIAEKQRDVKLETVRDTDYGAFVNDRAQDNVDMFLGKDPMFNVMDSDQITLMTLDALRKEVKKENITRGVLDAFLSRPMVKQIEKDTIRGVADTIEKDGNINIAELTKAVEESLLLLGVTDSREGFPLYEHIVLPTKIRGVVSDYYEKVYTSPIKNSAGKVHFRDADELDNYFGHTRVEDMAQGATFEGYDINGDPMYDIPSQADTRGGVRRVIEVQSDLFQKGRLSEEYVDLIQGIDTLMPYKNTWWEYMIRREIKQASQDEKDYIYFPTGETAMKIEGLGSTNAMWVDSDDTNHLIQIDELKQGKEIVESRPDNQNPGGNELLGNRWIITEVLGDGKFKAIPEDSMSMYEANELQAGRFVNDVQNSRDIETFDISGKVDVENPIYKFYEKSVGKYLKNNFNGGLITDDQGVTWWAVHITPEIAERTVYAFNTGKGVQVPVSEEAQRYMRTEITGEAGVTLLKTMMERMKLNFPVEVVEDIFTGEQKRRNGIVEELGRAYGVTFNNEIVFAPTITQTTPQHEFLHMVLRNLPKLRVFNGITAQDLFNAQYGSSVKNLTEAQLSDLEEQLARGYEAYTANRSIEIENETLVQKFYRIFHELMRDMYRAFGGKTGLDIVADFYDRLARGKETGETRVLIPNPLVDAKIRFKTTEGTQVLNFSELVSDKRTSDRHYRSAFFKKIVNDEVATNKVFENENALNFIMKDINMLENVTAQARDIYLKDTTQFVEAQNVERVGDKHDADKELLDRNFAEMISPYMQLKGSDKERVEKALWLGDELGKEFNEAELIRMSLSEQAIKAYFDLRDAFLTAHEMLLLEMIRKGVNPVEIDTFRQERDGYMPHKWKFPYVVKFQRKVEDMPGFQTWHMESYKGEKEAVARQKTLTDENNDPTIRYAVDKLQSLEVDFFSSLELSSERIQVVIENMREEGYVKDHIVDILKKNLMEMFKEKGFGRHFLRRVGIRGYDTDNTPEIVANYFSGFTGYITKMRWSGEYFQVLSQIDARRQPEFFNWMRDLIAYKLNNKAEWRLVRTISFAWYLANDISYLAVNALQNWTVGMGELSKYVTGAEKAWKPEAYILKATNDWARNKLSTTERAVIEGLLERGHLGAEMSGELMGFKNNPLYNEISSRFSKIMYSSTAIVEKNINRIPAFLAALRIFTEQGMGHEQAVQKALDVSNDIHFRYGRHHRPRMMRGRVNVLFVFQHYLRSLLYQLYRDASRREFISLTRKMMYTTALGGTLALPFAKLLLMIFAMIADDNDDEELKQEVGFWKILITRGAPAALLQLDLSGRVGIEMLSVNKIMDDPTDVRGYMGVIGDLLFKRPFDIINLVSQERGIDALAKGLPDMFANPIKGYTGYVWGVRSINGTPLEDFEGKEYKYNAWEAILKGLGFTPTMEGVLWDEKAKEWAQNDETSQERTTLRRKIQGQVQRGDIEEARKTQADALEAGIIKEDMDYVREFGMDRFVDTALIEWNESAKTRADIKRIEGNLINDVYSNKATDDQKNNIRKEFAVYRQFGVDDSDVNDILKARTNKDKVEILVSMKNEMGEEAFNEFFKKGRSKITTEAGKPVPILISDDLRELYLKAIKDAE